VHDALGFGSVVDGTRIVGPSAPIENSHGVSSLLAASGSANREMSSEPYLPAFTSGIPAA
jgi:hypothetical protein